MKKQIKSALVSVAVAAAAVSAQAAAYNNDLILGFTAGTGGPGNDVLFDLGSAASLFNGEQWHLGSLLSGSGLVPNTVLWGVSGNSAGTLGNRIVYHTFASTAAAFGSGNGNSANTADTSIYGAFAIAGAGQSATVTAGTDNSWNNQTVHPTLPGQLFNVYGNTPDATGLTSIAFWTQQANSSAAVQGLNFTLSQDGTVTYGAVAVPEPATYGALAGAGLLALSLRGQLRRKQA